MDIELLAPESAEDQELIAGLTALINQVYADGEKGLWNDGAARTSAPEIAGLVRRGQIAVARRDGRVIGTVRVQRLGPGLGEFGQLATAPHEQGTGTGRALVGFAEDWARARGLATMQLELLVPDAGEHPVKEFLRAWYTRIGYRVTGTQDIAAAHPGLAPLLAGPSTLLVLHKSLA